VVSVTLYAYQDQAEGFYGYLAYGSAARPLAAGGLRVQPGLTAERIEALAATMQGKENMLRLNVDGAKCGIDYDPAAPGKREALRRFLGFLTPHLKGRLSLGPDMGTSFEEIEAIAREEGIPSVKCAVGRAQGLAEAEVLARLELLDQPVGPLTLGRRRAGHGLAHAALAAGRWARRGRPGQASCALQGFGTLARGAALTLHSRGVRFTAIADEHGCLLSPTGLPLPDLLRLAPGTPLTDAVPAGATAAPREAVLSAEADVLVLAACEDALAGSEVAAVRAGVVAVGANGGLTPAEYDRFAERGVAVVPDLIASAGGSAAMDALFAPGHRPEPASVLENVAWIAATLTQRALGAAEPPLQAARRMADANALPATAPPYGLRVLVERPVSVEGAARIPAGR
jgi:glutamate dehydrogenase (NAD(P)+)